MNVSNYSSITISIVLQPCPRGWERNKDRCECDRRLKYFNITSCNITGDTVKRVGSTWLRYDEQYLKGHTHCPLDYCDVTSDSISLAQPDEQCTRHHSGVTCGACQENYSIALGGSKCLQCTSSLAFLWLLPLFAVAGIALVVQHFIKNFGSTLDKLQTKPFQLFPIQKSVLYNILKVLRNPKRGKYRKWVIR